MKHRLKKRIANSISALTEGAGEMQKFLNDAGVGEATSFAVDLAYEELITNSIKYAWADSLPHSIHFEVVVDETAVELEVRDDGQPFDPTNQPEPDTSIPVEDRPIGGLGLHLIKNLTDSFTYRRQDGYNCVQIRKLRIGE